MAQQLPDPTPPKTCAMLNVVGGYMSTHDRWFEAGTHMSAETLVLQAKTDELAPDTVEMCSICRDDLAPAEPCISLNLCPIKHYFHEQCITEAMRALPRCPNCLTAYGPMHGNQPEGQMTIMRADHDLPGYPPASGCFIILYRFLDGIQTTGHPAIGQMYTGTARRAMLTATPQGTAVLNKLMRAWDARILFTIGRSLTTGQDNCVIWNNIHHKTSMTGGPYGYPDATYLDRVSTELATAGIL